MRTKYKSSMEKVAGTIETFCSFPLIEKQKLFRITLFNFLYGNEDMHLKNFSLISRDDKIELSPAYDLVNSTIALSKPMEELALPLNGNKSKLYKEVFVDYFGKSRLGLTNVTIDKVLGAIHSQKEKWDELISISFLSDEMKDKYNTLLNERWSRIF